MDIKSSYAMDIINFSNANISTDEAGDGRDRCEYDVKNYCTGRTTWGTKRARVNKSPSSDVPSYRTALATTDEATNDAAERTAIKAAGESPVDAAERTAISPAECTAVASTKRTAVSAAERSAV